MSPVADLKDVVNAGIVEEAFRSFADDGGQSCW